MARRQCTASETCREPIARRSQDNPQFCEFHDSVARDIESTVRKHYGVRGGVLAGTRAIAQKLEG